MTELQEKAMRMAFEALMQKGEHHPKVYQAAEAIRQALAQPCLENSEQATSEVNYCKDFKQEPVAYYYESSPGKRGVSLYKETEEWQPLYTAPPKREWVGLTDEEMSELANKYKHIETGWRHDNTLAQPVDAVNISAERVDETAKGEHEPVAYKEECWACGCEECICATKVPGYYESKIKEAILAEREACAKLLEDAAFKGTIISCTSAAKAIRARGEK